MKRPTPAPVAARPLAAPPPSATINEATKNSSSAAIAGNDSPAASGFLLTRRPIWE
ncbi:unnamed protein product [Staurois parvus]|uniref:Uncharacterized protein n=1 Tax=Staurois parvus TaxID=386267 RepID=A0ABN9DUF5_9NEOB|nr:unnamed protein product [Staurois parvus]